MDQITIPLDESPTFYDYENQAWVKDGKYVRCGHPDYMGCKCFGKIHEGEEFNTTEEEN